MIVKGKTKHDVRCISFSIVALRRRKSSASQPKTSGADQKLEKVHYSTRDVDLNQNAAYEAVKYPDEVIYEHAT